MNNKDIFGSVIAKLDHDYTVVLKGKKNIVTFNSRKV